MIFVEVGVDPDFGLLRLRRAVGVYSAGRIVNPLTARAQMTGGIIWGWGKATMEESDQDPVHGRWLAKNLSNVAVPVNADIPADIDVSFTDEYDEAASLIGARGIGELGATGVDAAVAAAVHDAVGVRVRDLPILPCKVRSRLDADIAVTRAGTLFPGKRIISARPGRRSLNRVGNDVRGVRLQCTRRSAIPRPGVFESEGIGIDRHNRSDLEQKAYMGTERSLIHVPVLHSSGDMGSLASVIPRPTDYGAQVGRYWDAVEADFRAMRRRWQEVRVYQDGLPDTRADIVARIVADVDSPNYRLLRWLASQGAIVIGTEDPILLQEEYELLKASVTDEAARQAYAARATGLLESRDRYIATRINDTLPSAGTGVLFVGLQHEVTKILPPDIEVTSLRSCHELLSSIVRKLGITRAKAAGQGQPEGRGQH